VAHLLAMLLAGKAAFLPSGARYSLLLLSPVLGERPRHSITSSARASKVGGAGCGAYVTAVPRVFLYGSVQNDSSCNSQVTICWIVIFITDIGIHDAVSIGRGNWQWEN